MIVYDCVLLSERYATYRLRLQRHIPEDLILSNVFVITSYLAFSATFRIRNMYRNNLVTKSEYFFLIVGNTVGENEAML